MTAFLWQSSFEHKWKGSEVSIAIAIAIAGSICPCDVRCAISYDTYLCTSACAHQMNEHQPTPSLSDLLHGWFGGETNLSETNNFLYRLTQVV